MTKKVLLVALLAAALGVAGCRSGEEGGEGGGLLSSVKPKPAPIVIPAGTNLDVRLNTGLSSEDNTAGDTFEGELEDPLVVGEKVVIPKGAEVKGKVTKAVKSGRLKQRAELWVTLTEVTFRGKPWPVTTTTTGHKEGSKTTRNILFIGGGGGAGAAIGGIAGGGKGAGIGAAIGAGSGLAGAMLTGKRDIKFPPETLLRFELEEQLTIQQ
ncbi:MAG: hypothetical protein ACRD5I_11115 [Candidatus Acidiferrales bacterium]